MTVYKLRYSNLVKVLSLIALMSCLVCFYFIVFDGERPMWLRLALGLPLAVIIFYPVISMPLSLEVTDEGITLKRLCWTTRYPSQRYEIERYSPLDFGSAIRISGWGGYFGCRGYFYNKREGLFKLTQVENETKYFRLRPYGKKRWHYIGYQ